MAVSVEFEPAPRMIFALFAAALFTCITLYMEIHNKLTKEELDAINADETMHFHQDEPKDKFKYKIWKSSSNKLNFWFFLEVHFHNLKDLKQRLKELLWHKD